MHSSAESCVSSCYWGVYPMIVISENAKKSPDNFLMYFVLDSMRMKASDTISQVGSHCTFCYYTWLTPSHNPGLFSSDQFKIQQIVFPVITSDCSNKEKIRKNDTAVESCHSRMRAPMMCLRMKVSVCNQLEGLTPGWGECRSNAVIALSLPLEMAVAGIWDSTHAYMVLLQQAPKCVNASSGSLRFLCYSDHSSHSLLQFSVNLSHFIAVSHKLSCCISEGAHLLY